MVKHLEYFDFLFKNYITKFNGNLVECGLGKGKTLETFCYLLKRYNYSPDIFCFDSFEGFPQPSKFDDKKIRKGKRSEKWLSFEQAKKLITKLDYPTDNIHLVKGFYQQTIEKYNGGPIFFLHLDCDLYESYKIAFKLYDHVVKGGLVLFDEYKDKIWPGATRAIGEFLKEKNKKVKEYKYSNNSRRHYVIK